MYQYHDLHQQIRLIADLISNWKLEMKASRNMGIVLRLRNRRSR